MQSVNEVVAAIEQLFAEPVFDDLRIKPPVGCQKISQGGFF